MSQTAAEALKRIKAQIAGKSRESRRGRAPNGIMVHETSCAEVEPQDVLALIQSIPEATVKADRRLDAIRQGSDGHEQQLVVLHVVDLDCLVQAVEKANPTLAQEAEAKPAAPPAPAAGPGKPAAPPAPAAGPGEPAAPPAPAAGPGEPAAPPQGGQP